MGRTRLEPLSSWFIFPSLVIAVVGGGGVIAVNVVDALSSLRFGVILMLIDDV